LPTNLSLSRSTFQGCSRLGARLSELRLGFDSSSVTDESFRVFFAANHCEAVATRPRAVFNVVSLTTDHQDEDKVGVAVTGGRGGGHPHGVLVAKP
jgi:hypothetical protein